jgi:hypothetical protein
MSEVPTADMREKFGLTKNWRYRWWEVNYNEFPKCGGRFKWQVDLDGRRKSYVMKIC